MPSQAGGISCSVRIGSPLCPGPASYLPSRCYSMVSRGRTPDDPHRNGWRATDGEGEIKPGVVAGGCVFLTPEAERVLRDQRRMSCEVTRHQVWFRGELRRWAPAPPGKPSTTLEPDPPLSVELSSTEIMGVRYTVLCDEVDSLLPPR